MSDPFEKPVVVIDNGSYNIKAGFACDNHPLSIFRTVVGRPKYLQGSYGKTPYDVYIGDDAVERSGELDLCYPVVKGRIYHWDNMERVWHHIFYRELKSAPEDRAVLLSCAPSTTLNDNVLYPVVNFYECKHTSATFLTRVKCCEVFFENLNSPALCVKPQSVLALFGSGCTTGLSVDLGDHTTEIQPIYEGGSLSYANMETKIAGDDLANFMKDSFEKRGINLGSNADKIIKDLQTNYLYVSKHGVWKRKDSYDYQKTYKLPSGEKIDLNEEIFMAGEMYFQPELVMGNKTHSLSLHEAIMTAVLKCDSDLQPEMYDAIVIHGGMANMPGLVKRLSRELEAIIHRPVKIKCHSETYALAWFGGAVYASILGAREVWVSKKQFEEHGEKIIRNKF